MYKKILRNYKSGGQSLDTIFPSVVKQKREKIGRIIVSILHTFGRIKLPQ